MMEAAFLFIYLRVPQVRDADSDSLIIRGKIFLQF